MMLIKGEHFGDFLNYLEDESILIYIEKKGAY